MMMMSLADAMLWLASVMLALMITCSPPEVEAALGIPDFLEMGKCAKVPLKEDFDPVKYSGLWFDIESVPNEYQHTKKCVTQNYSWKDNYMTVNTRGLTAVGKKVRQGAVMRVEKESVPQPNPAHMTVDAAGVPAAPYQIVSSDYRTYSCVYSCLEYFGFRAEFFWVFGRTPTLPAEKIQLCHTTFESLKIDYKKMVPIIQGEPCPYADKLDEMLQQNEEYLLNVLGPYVPTSSPPTPLPAITLSPNAQAGAAAEEELKEIKAIVQEEKKIVQELEAKVLPNSIGNKAGTASQEMSDDSNSAITASSSASVILLIITAFVTALLQH